ncbi:MAG: malonic semialdehyde reductase [Hyphomicrobium sp.]
MPHADDAALRQGFLDARTHNAWQAKEVPDTMLRRLIEVVQMGPTSANCEPARYVFVKSAEAKAKLKPLLSEGNREKTMQAPVCAIIGYDMEFYEQLSKTFPHKDMRSAFVGNPEKILDAAFRNSSLQGAYLIIAARLLGLDCGPMSGFDAAGVDAAFFAGTAYRSNFLCNLGYGDPSKLMPRLPRLDFDEVAQIV